MPRKIHDENDRNDRPPIRAPKHQQTEVGALEQGTQGKPDRKDRAHVRITIRRRRLLDPDNAYASVKDLLDGIRDAGLILDDSEERITLEVNQEKAGKGEDEGTRIEIDYECIDSQTKFSQGAR